MGSLSWKNVTSSINNTGAAALKNAGSLFGAAFDKFSGVAETAQKDLETSNTAQALDALKQVNTAEDFEAQKEGLSLQANLDKYGDNFDQAAVSRAYDTKLSEIQTKERADLQYEQGQTDRDRRLAREKILTGRSDKAYGRQQQAIADQESADAAISGIPTDQEIKTNNDNVINKSLQLFNQLNPSFEGQAPLATISPAGEVVFNPAAADEDKTKFAQIIEQQGGLQNFTSLEQKISQAAIATKSLPFKFQEQVRNALRSTVNADNLSTQEKNEIATYTNTVTTAAANELALLKQNFDNRLARVKENQTKSEEEIQVEATSLLEYTQKQFPDPGFLSSRTGNLGGQELTAVLQKYVSDGITIDGKQYAVEPTLLREAVASATEHPSDPLFADRTVDDDDLAAFLKKAVIKQGNKKTIAYKDTLQQEYLKSQAAITTASTQSIKDITNRLKAKRGGVNKDRNLNLRQAFANRAVNR